MNPIAVVAHSPLTQSDITRLPNGAVTTTPAAAQTISADTFEPQQKKSSKLKKAIIGIIGIAAISVALKRFAPNLLKVDANNAKWTDYIKKGITKIADCAEWPFVKAKQLFTGKKVDAAPAGTTPAPAAGSTPAATAGASAGNAAGNAAGAAGNAAGNAAGSAATEGAKAGADAAAAAGTSAAPKAKAKAKVKAKAKPHSTPKAEHSAPKTKAGKTEVKGGKKSVKAKGKK